MRSKHVLRRCSTNSKRNHHNVLGGRIDPTTLTGVIAVLRYPCSSRSLVLGETVWEATDLDGAYVGLLDDGLSFRELGDL